MINIQTGTFSRCHKYLDRIGTINQKNVQKLSPEVKDFLRSVTPVRLKELADMNCLAANEIKTELDKQYGVNNYVLVTIGRSLSSIAELLSYNGVSVKQIPISGLRTSDISSASPKNLAIYKSFFETIELSKEKLKKNSDKTYILTDYVYKGRSLTKMSKFLNSKDILDSPENLVCLPIDNIMGNKFQSSHIKDLLEFSRFKYFSVVGKLYPKNLNRVFIQSTQDLASEYRGNINKGVRKLFWFNVFDSLLNEDYKKVIPQKELSSIKKNFLSQSAISNFIKQQQKEIKQL